jgi:hypothetical protein
MGVPPINHTPFWLLQTLEGMKKPEVLKHNQPVEFPLPYNRTQVRSPLGSPADQARLAGGLALLEQAGPVPQGTTNMAQILGRAGSVAAQAFGQAKQEEEARKSLAAMEQAVRSPEMLANLTPQQQALILSLPAPKALEALTDYRFRENELPNYQFIRDEANGRVLVTNPKTGTVVREIEIGKDAPKLTFQKQGEDIVALHPEDGTEVARIPGVDAGAMTQEERGRLAVDLQDKFARRPEAAIWAETLVQLRGAQGAAAAKNPVADLQLIVAYAKILDPTSVVREGEVTVVRDTGSIPDWLVGRYNKATGEGLIGFQHRDNLLASIERVARQRYSAFQRLQGMLAPLYQDLGYDADRIMGSQNWEIPTWVTGLSGTTKTSFDAGDATGSNSPLDLLGIKR